MSIMLVALAVAVLGAVVAKPAARRLAKSRQLRLAEASEVQKAEEEHKRRKKAEAEAYTASLHAYFSAYGFKTAERMETPRQASMGTLHLTEVSRSCPKRCGRPTVTLHEIAPGRSDSHISGVVWDDIGRYCPQCGAWETNDSYIQHFKPNGPLGKRLRGATNLFDIIGDPKTVPPEDEWQRLGSEEAELEARLNGVRSRRLALAERLGKPLGAPFRPQLAAGGDES